MSFWYDIRKNKYTSNGNDSWLRSYVEKKISELLSQVNSALLGKVDKVTGKALSTNDYTTAEKSKLSGIEAGAQVNTVTSVAGKVGSVTLSKGDVGLSNVDNTSDLNKPISTATKRYVDEKSIGVESIGGAAGVVTLSQLGLSKGVANGVASLDENGKVTDSQIQWELITGSNSSPTLILADKTAVRLGELESLTISTPASVTNPLFECSLVFSSGDTATTLSSSGIIWTGADCDADRDFIPTLNKSYEISFAYINNTIVARVGEF